MKNVSFDYFDIIDRERPYPPACCLTNCLAALVGSHEPVGSEAKHITMLDVKRWCSFFGVLPAPQELHSDGIYLLIAFRGSTFHAFLGKQIDGQLVEIFDPEKPHQRTPDKATLDSRLIITYSLAVWQPDIYHLSPFEMSNR